MARRVEIDKQGRVRLPENLLTWVGLSGDVALIGVKDHLEVWDDEAWAEYLRQLLKDKPGMLMNPRGAMRQPEQ